MRYLPFLISLGLTIYALFSCIQTPDEEVPYLPKLVWVILIVLVPFAGPIVWLLMARAYRERLAAGGGGGRGGGGPARGSGPSRQGPPGRPQRSAPDDDPEFLAWLDRQQRRNKPPAPKPPAKPAGPAGPTEPTGPTDSSKSEDGAPPDETGKGEQNEDEARPHDE